MRHVLMMMLCVGALLLVGGCTKKSTDFEILPDVQPLPPVVLEDVQEADGIGPAPIISRIIPHPTHEVIHFDFGSHVLKAAAKRVLNDVVVAAVAGARKIHSVILKGGACPIGEWGYNRRLGLRRGNTAYEYLKDKIKDDAMVIISVGEDELVSDVPSEYWRNRRCEVDVVYE